MSVVAPNMRIRSATAADFPSLCDIDSDASALFLAVGLDIESPYAYEFERTEQLQWLKCLSAGNCWIAMTPDDEPAGFVAMSLLDTQPYVQQISVRTRFMRRGMGTSLIAQIARAALEAGHSTLWLTTYGHLAWNRPFYESSGFELMPELGCGPELRAVLDYERRWLPQPDMRIVMRKQLDGSPTLRNAS